MASPSSGTALSGDEERRRMSLAVSAVVVLLAGVVLAFGFVLADPSPWGVVLLAFGLPVVAVVNLREYVPSIYFGWPHPLLERGETLVWDEKSVLLERRSVPGGIALTDRRLIFTPDRGVFRQLPAQSWNPDDIVEVTSGSRKPPSQTARWVGDLHIIFADGSGIAIASLTPEQSRASFVDAWLSLPELPRRR